jgi:hypothetical protein
MGVPQFLFLIEILNVLLVRSPCKVSLPYDNPFWEISNPRRRRNKEREKRR